VPNDFNKEPEASLFAKALPLFINEYKQNACKRSRLYDGVKEGLAYLISNQFKLACVTNKQSQFTHTILETLGIQNTFGIVISGDTLPKKKPDPLPLLHAAKYFGVSASQALMVGDSINDVSAAGFQVLCVSSGYNLGQDIRLANPDLVVDSLAAFPDVFQVAA
jgi:phosphoglycolate phosphatase